MKKNKNIPLLHGDYPKFCNDKFYQNFDDPLRAYENLPFLYRLYSQYEKQHFESISFPSSEIDHINYAWMDANNQSYLRPGN
jgi:hypothetical protein